MRAIRGVLACTGITMLYLASCASEWEPLPILILGLSGLALFCVARALPDRVRAKKKAAGRAGTRTDGKR